MNAKVELAKERRERFQTGGGSLSTKDGMSSSTSIISGVCQNQMPLSGIFDDDHVDSDSK